MWLYQIRWCPHLIHHFPQAYHLLKLQLLVRSPSDITNMGNTGWDVHSNCCACAVSFFSWHWLKQTDFKKSLQTSMFVICSPATCYAIDSNQGLDELQLLNAVYNFIQLTVRLRMYVQTYFLNLVLIRRDDDCLQKLSYTKVWIGQYRNSSALCL